ncbi:MAG TPA: Fe-S-containing protein [Thermoanaerobaculia bacterium]|nr:Fe-S-containing protein [Thermoanaerobaculia bacterium]
MRFRPVHGILAIGLFVVVGLVAELALAGRLGKNGFERVSAGDDHVVSIDVAKLAPLQVRFYRFLNPANQEVKFFVGRDGGGTIQVAFDASEVCFKTKRGFKAQGDWVVCNKCDKSFRLAGVNNGHGGCEPVQLAHRVVGNRVLIAEQDVLTGWRYFR